MYHPDETPRELSINTEPDPDNPHKYNAIGPNWTPEQEAEQTERFMADHAPRMQMSIGRMKALAVKLTELLGEEITWRDVRESLILAQVESVGGIWVHDRNAYIAWQQRQAAEGPPDEPWKNT